MTPAKVVLGYELPDFGDWTIVANVEAAADEPNREHIIREVNERQEEYKAKYASPELRTNLTFRVGQQVLVRSVEKRKDTFRCPWVGPYLVTRKVSDEIYEVNKNGLISALHIDDIRPAPVREPEEQEDETSESPPETDDDSTTSSEEDEGDTPVRVTTTVEVHQPPRVERKTQLEADVTGVADPLPNPGNEATAAEVADVSHVAGTSQPTNGDAQRQRRTEVTVFPASTPPQPPIRRRRRARIFIRSPPRTQESAGV